MHAEYLITLWNRYVVLNSGSLNITVNAQLFLSISGIEHHSLRNTANGHAFDK